MATVIGGGAYRIGGGVSSPVLIYQVEPEYTEEACKAKWQGAVLSLVVDKTGQPQGIKVTRSLGLAWIRRPLKRSRSGAGSPA